MFLHHNAVLHLYIYNFMPLTPQDLQVFWIRFYWIGFWFWLPVGTCWVVLFGGCWLVFARVVCVCGCVAVVVVVGVVVANVVVDGSRLFLGKVASVLLAPAATTATLLANAKNGVLVAGLPMMV